MRRRDEGDGFGGVDPDQGTALAAGAIAIVRLPGTPDRRTFLLGYARPRADQEPDPVSELGVVGDAGELDVSERVPRLAADRGWRPAG